MTDFDPADYVYAKGVPVTTLVVMEDGRFTPEAVRYFEERRRERERASRDPGDRPPGADAAGRPE